MSVTYVPGSLFYANGRSGSCIWPAFSRAEEAEIDVGIRRLATLLGRGSTS